MHELAQVVALVLGSEVWLDTYVFDGATTLYDENDITMIVCLG